MVNQWTTDLIDSRIRFWNLGTDREHAFVGRIRGIASDHRGTVLMVQSRQECSVSVDASGCVDMLMEVVVNAHWIEVLHG